MYSHFTLGSNDLEKSKTFYDPVLNNLGLVLLSGDADKDYLMYGLENGDFPHLFVSRPFDDLPATWSNGFHLAFNADSQASVEGFYESAMQNGGTDEGEPGLREHYDEDYFAAYVRDPDGNKLQAVCYLNGRRHGQTNPIISHITFGLAELNREKKFYDGILGALGIQFLPEESDHESCGYGNPDSELPVFYVQPTFDGRPATWGNGVHVALLAESRKQVDDFHHQAISNGGTSDGAPGLRPQYSPNYYAAYVRDPLGNKLQAVCRQE